MHEVLLIRPDANAFVFGDLDVDNKDLVKFVKTTFWEHLHYGCFWINFVFLFLVLILSILLTITIDPTSYLINYTHLIKFPNNMVKTPLIWSM